MAAWLARRSHWSYCFNCFFPYACNGHDVKLVSTNDKHFSLLKKSSIKEPRRYRGRQFITVGVCYPNCCEAILQTIHKSLLKLMKCPLHYFQTITARNKIFIIHGAQCPAAKRGIFAWLNIQCIFV